MNERLGCWLRLEFKIGFGQVGWKRFMRIGGVDVDLRGTLIFLIFDHPI